MKVLSVTWSIYDSRLSLFAKNCTGGGLVIRNICEYIGRKADSYLFLGAFPLPKMELGNIRIVETINKGAIKGSTKEDKEKYLLDILRVFSETLADLQPDIVNIHGSGDFTRECIKICNKKKIPCVYTEHLYIRQNGLVDRIDESYQKALDWQKKIYAAEPPYIVAVSTGTKDRIKEDYPALDNITVIKNGTDFRAEYILSDLNKKNDIDNKKVLLCVGTVLERKNQKQLVRSFKLLDNNLQENIRIIFCGRDCLNGELQALIREYSLENKIYYAGSASSEEMKKYYSVSNGLAMPSLAEGLSIAALENIAYGQPVIMFKDSECAEDLNDDKVCVFAPERTDESFAEAIEKWYKTEWDNSYIKEYSKYFSMERVADDYLDFYKSILKKNN